MKHDVWRKQRQIKVNIAFQRDILLYIISSQAVFLSNNTKSVKIACVLDMKS